MPPDIRTGPPGPAGVLPPGQPAGLFAGPPGQDGLAALFAGLLARSSVPQTNVAIASPSPSGVQTEPLKTPPLKDKKDPLPEKQAAQIIRGSLLPPLPLPIQMRPPATPTGEVTGTRPKINKNAMDTVPASPAPVWETGATRPASELPLPGAGTILSQAPPVFSGLLIPKPASAAPVPPSLAASTLTRPVTPPALSQTSVAETALSPTLPALPRPVAVASVGASVPAPQTFLVPQALPAPSGAVVTAGASGMSAVAPRLAAAPQAVAPPQMLAVSAHPQEAPVTVVTAPLVREPRLIPTPAEEPNTVVPKADTPQTAMTPPVPTALNTAYTVAPQTVVVLMSSLEQSILPSPKPTGLTANAPQTAAVKDAAPNTDVPQPIIAAGLKPSALPSAAPAAVNAPPAVVIPQAAAVAELERILRPADSLPAVRQSGSAPTDGLKTEGAITDTSARTSARNQDVPAAPGKQPQQTQTAELRLQVVGKRTTRTAEDAAPETAPALQPSVANAPAASIADKPLTHAERAEMVRQVADGVGAMRLPAKPGVTEQMTLQLHPKDWGRLQVSVQIVAPARPDVIGLNAVRTQTVTAHVIAETPQVKAALENGASELRQTLRAAGLHLDKLTVTVRAPEGSAQSGTATGGGHHFAGGGQTPPERTANAPAGSPSGGSPNGGSASFASFANQPGGGGRGGEATSTPPQAPEADEDVPTTAPAPTGRRGQIDMRA